MTPIRIRPAKSADAALIFALVTELAAYENLAADVDATSEALAAALFRRDPRVFCDIAEHRGEAAGIAVWFYSFSTFRGRHGIWVEDIFLFARLFAAEGLARRFWRGWRTAASPNISPGSNGRSSTGTNRLSLSIKPWAPR